MLGELFLLCIFLKYIIIFQCLKESYVKAVGVGISINLQRIDFHTKTKAVEMKPGVMVSDTEVCNT